MAYRIDAEAGLPPAAPRFVADDEEDEGEDDFEGWSEGGQPTRALFVADTTVYPSPEAALAQAAKKLYEGEVDLRVAKIGRAHV